MTEKRKFLTVIVGPTCSGKTTLQKLLSERGFVKVVTTTTRAPRPGERQGLDYHFITKEVFDSFVAEDLFYEHETFRGNSYGVSKAAIEDAFASSRFCTVITEPKGLDSLLLKLPIDINVKVIVIHASLPTLMARLQNRGASEEEILSRAEGLKQELALVSYKPSYGKRIISPTSLKQLQTFADHYDPRDGHIEEQIQLDVRPGLKMKVA